MRRVAVLALMVLAIGSLHAAEETPQQPAPPSEAPAARTAPETNKPAAPSEVPSGQDGSDGEDRRGGSVAQVDAESLDGLDSPPVGTIVHTTEPQTKRPVSFYVPTSYRKGRPMPLLAAFTAPGVGRGNITQFWRLGEDHGIIIVTPDTWAVRGSPEDRVKAERMLKAWSREVGETKVPNYVRDVNEILADLRADAEAVRQSIAMLSTHYAVDPKLLVLTGCSGGAWIAYYTGLADPRRYAGICIRSGNFDRRLLPPNLRRARDMPISIVIGDQDMPVVLTETDKAEEHFKSLKFTQLNVERLPNSGHDRRPEVAMNFVALLRGEVMSERKEAWQKSLKAGLAAVEQKQTNTARYELGRAAELERQFGFPDEATRALAALDAGDQADGKQPSAGDGQTEKPATD